MRERIDEEVTVVMYYSSKKKKVVPYRLQWQNKEYTLGEVDYYHSYLEGQERYHYFELTDVEQTLWFRLKLDGSNLHWTLEAIDDGLTS